MIQTKIRRNRPVFWVILLTMLLAFTGLSCRKARDGGVFKSEDAGENWQQKVYVGKEKRKVVSIADVNIENLFFDPLDSKIVYAATKSSGVYKSSSAGEQWEKINAPSARIRDMVIDPDNTAIMYIPTNNLILKTIDGGISWETIYTDAQNAIIEQLEVDWYDSSRIFASTSIGTLLLTEDFGSTWRVIYTVEEPIRTLIFDRVDSRIITFVEYEKNIYQSFDGGVNWQELLTKEARKQLKSSWRIRNLIVDPNNPVFLYGLLKEGIIKSMDRGQNWSYLSTLIELGADQNKSISTFTIAPNNSDTLFFVVGHFLHKSFDNAATWRTIETFPSGRNITALVYEPNNENVIYAGTTEIAKKSNNPFQIKK